MQSSGYAQFEWRYQPEGSSLWSVLSLARFLEILQSIAPAEDLGGLLTR
jgi:hypothetical protein